MRYRELSAKVPEIPVFGALASTVVIDFGLLALALSLGLITPVARPADLDGIGLAVYLCRLAALSAWIFFWARWSDGWSPARLGLSGPWVRPALCGLLVGAVLPVGALALRAVLQDQRPVQAIVDAGIVLSHAPVYYLVAVPLLLLSQELLLRGYVLRRLAARRGPRYAVAVSTLLYALGQYAILPPGLGRFLVLLGVGLLLGLVYLRSGSLWASFAAYVCMKLGVDLMNYNAGGAGNWPVSLVLLLLAGGLAFRLFPPDSARRSELR